jgi:hypothetical protein
MRRNILLYAAIALLCAGFPRKALAETPQEYHERVFRNQGLKLEGEDFCWQARYHLDGFLHGYLAYGDTQWLDWGVKYYEFLVAKMHTAPDGYKGWIGPYEYDHSVWSDVHVGDAILTEGLLSFAEVVLKDPGLKAKYGEAANRYIAIAKHDVMEKWDRRGTWYEDGPYGGYVAWTKYLDPGKLDEFHERKEIAQSGLSLPFNKQNDMALVALKLYRITREQKYLDRATKIFAFMKSRFHFFDNHYVWNYWEPLGPWDVDVQKADARHWVGVHPYRNYQDREVNQIVEAYQAGVIFNRTDIERILNTNLKIMWNKDRDNPAFVNSDDTYPESGRSASHWSASNPYAKSGHAGCLWTALVDFDQTVRDLYQRSLGRGLLRAYYDNVINKRTAGFERKYADRQVSALDFPFSESREIKLAAALPSVFKAGEKTILIGSSVVRGDVEVALYSSDGKKKQRVLGHSAVMEWDGAGLKGDYRVRWTFGGGYREFPITIQ